MATKIRLQRHGRKKRPIYHIVVADERSKRDGRYIEKLGIFNPNTNPSSVDLDFNRSLYWVETGAQPTDTARRILSENGVMMKKHLNGGVRKGAHTQEEADAKFEKWLEEKGAKVQAAMDAITAKKDEEAKARFEAEAKVNEERAKVLAEAKAALAAEAEAATAEAAAEETSEEAPAEEAPTAEAEGEAPAEETPAAE